MAQQAASVRAVWGLLPPVCPPHCRLRGREAERSVSGRAAVSKQALPAALGGRRRRANGGAGGAGGGAQSHGCAKSNARPTSCTATSPADVAPDVAASASAVPVAAVLFDMDGVLCDSEAPSRATAVEVFRELGYEVTQEDFIPFAGTGEANFLGGVAKVYNVPSFDPEKAKQRFFELYISKYAQPGAGIGFSGALELIEKCKEAGLKMAVASSADRIKVNANLTAAGLPQSNFGSIMSADKFERLKPFPDIFLAAAESLGVPPEQCVVIEDALAGVQAARAAGMRCIAVTTTLDADALQAASPDLILPDISHITIEQIMSLPAPPPDAPAEAEAAAERLQSSIEATSSFSNTSVQLESRSSSSGGLSGTTRSRLIRFAALVGGVAGMSIVVTRLKEDRSVKHFLRKYNVGIVVEIGIIAYAALSFNYVRKTMQYASPMAIWNTIFGAGNPMAEANFAGSERMQMLQRYFADMESSGKGRTVPEFPSGQRWFNSPPLRLAKELKGQVVVLDFWTYCCINCMHILPELASLERKYAGQPVTVVGVHSAKFDNEKDDDAIRNAVLRYDISHPVINDKDMALWHDLGISAWPTLALVSPTGKLLALLPGESHEKDLDELLQAALQYYSSRGMLSETPVPMTLEREKAAGASRLLFPGKIATHIPSNRLFISDSSNHRIIVTTLEGNFIAQIGNGAPALQDGATEEASFNRPQGVAYDAARDVLYIADTENHALREIDLQKGTVRTLAGNGTKGADYKGGGSGRSQVLNSPWDVCLDTGRKCLYIAMAGSHQIWRHDLVTGTTSQFSGNGYERNYNSRSGSDTSFAQPSGLALSPSGDKLYVADSESSSVRAVDLATGGSTSCVGGDPLFADNLFRFGDKDGSGSNALLQHPLAVLCTADGTVYVADSYNHKIKRLDSTATTVNTLAGTGKPGLRDGPAMNSQLSEPAGLAEGPDGKLFIADTNNSQIRVIDLKAAKSPITTLDLSSVPPVSAPTAVEKPSRNRRSPQLVRLETPLSGEQGELVLSITLPDGYHYTKGTSSTYEVQMDIPDVIAVQPPAGRLDGTRSPVLRWRRLAEGDVTATVACKVYFCQDDDVCLFKSINFEASFSSASSGGNNSTLNYDVPASAPQIVSPFAS
eukprot:jgi/Chlat1/92/Chrsp1S03080